MQPKMTGSKQLKWGQTFPELLKLKPFHPSENQYLLPSVTMKYMGTVRIAKAQSPILHLPIMCYWLMAEISPMATAQEGNGESTRRLMCAVWCRVQKRNQCCLGFHTCLVDVSLLHPRHFFLSPKASMSVYFKDRAYRRLLELAS